MILSYRDTLPAQQRTPRPFKPYISAANKAALETTMQRVDKISAAAYVIVLCVNDIADTALRDAVAALRTTQYYKHDVKRTVRLCLDKYDALSRRIESNLKHRFVFWMDLVDNYSATMQPHVEKLYWSVKARFDRDREKDSDVKARLITAEFMLDTAASNFKAYFDAMAERYGVDVRSAFCEADLTGIRRLFSHVCDIVLARKAGDRSINFASDANCNLAGRCIANNMVSASVINEAGRAALEAHPEFIPEGVSLEEYAKIL